MSLIGSIGRDAEHAREAQVPLLRYERAVRIGEVDRAVGLDHDVIRAVEALALKTVGDHRETAVKLAPRHPPGLVLAGDDAALLVAGEPVRLMGVLLEHGHALGTITVLVDDFLTPNGLAFSPDESILYINDTRRGHIRAFDVAPNGTLARQTDRVFADLTGPEPGVPAA
jgi:hypothetical protein